MEATTARPGYELWRPNREKAESKSAKALVTLLLLISAGLVLVVTIGGWSRLEGGPILNLPYAIIYVVFAYYVWRWQRGVLPVASALAIILAIFAAISAPAWFDRAKDGLTSPALPEDLLGVITLLIVPLQIILIAIAMVAFNQEWHVEEERPIGGVQDVDDEDADAGTSTSSRARKAPARRTRTTRRRRTA
jgi:lysylphosphatidylglycerol synthetase-like protein (DUF2156 family)